MRHDDMPPDRFHALELWGFDSSAKNFVAFIYDNFGGVRKFTSDGLAGDQLIWKGESTKADPPSHRTVCVQTQRCEPVGREL